MTQTLHHLDQYPIDWEDDSGLASRISEGDPDALHEAYRRHGRHVFLVAYGLLRREELAEDVTQDVFVRLWQVPERFDPERGSLASFLRIDAHGRAIDLIRSEEARNRRETAEEQRSSDHQAGAEDEAMSRITSEWVRDALAGLDDAERKPIAMAFYLGYSYRKVADLLGIPEGTAKSRIRSGLAKLRDTLGTELHGYI
jgi:RNA polymerase sigma-70 factor (ECF subfamily)